MYTNDANATNKYSYHSHKFVISIIHMKKQNNTLLAKPRECYFCKSNVKEIDYKDVQTLRRFISSYAKIVPRKRSGVCAKHQRKLATAIKRARSVALLPITNR